MTAISQLDLDNAKVDVDALAAFVNNATGPINTRLGLVIDKSLAELETFALGITQGPAGAQGIQGIQGIQGVTGAIDNTLLTHVGSGLVTGPEDLWTQLSTTASATELLRAAVDPADLHTDDADFGHCYEFSDNTNRLFGHAYPIEFKTDDVYKLEISYKVVTDDTINGGITRLFFGITTQQGFTQLDSNRQTSEFTATVADGVKTATCLFSTHDLLDQQAADFNPQSTSAGNLAYLHVRQNPSDVSNGLVRIGSFRITKVTAIVSTTPVAYPNSVVPVNYAHGIGIVPDPDNIGFYFEWVGGSVNGFVNGDRFYAAGTGDDDGSGLGFFVDATNATFVRRGAPFFTLRDGGLLSLTSAHLNLVFWKRIGL